MSGVGSSYDVAFGDVTQSQIVIGDHATVQTGQGVKIVYLVGDRARPEPRLRRLPVTLRPAEDPELVGRERELRAAAGATASAPVQLCGPDGIGKTGLLKHASHALRPGGDGVVFLRARRRPLEDLLL